MPRNTMPSRKPIPRGQLLIGGTWRDAADGATMPTSNPTTEAVNTSVAKASAIDSDAAVKAATHAFEHGPWGRMHHEQRAKVLLRMANDTPFGLASGIRTGDLGRALRLADRNRAGTVWINTWHKYHPNAPFGGFKMSGYGREQGAEALESYTQYKTVWANLGAA